MNMKTVFYGKNPYSDIRNNVTSKPILLILLYYIKTHNLSLNWTNVLSSCNDSDELINTFINIINNII